MHISTSARRIITAMTLTAAITIPAVAISASAASASPGTRAVSSETPQCRPNTNIIVWLGLNPDGAAAGTTFYPLEFSNVGVHTRTCWISGRPTVWAVAASNHKIGPNAGRMGGSGNRITLKPGQSAHALLGIVQKGFIAGCTNATAAGLEVRLPGSTASSPIQSFTFPACTNKVFMRVDAFATKVAIP